MAKGRKSGSGRGLKAHHLRRLDTSQLFEGSRDPVYNAQGDFAGWSRPVLGSSLIQKLAAKVWDGVTEGKGVVLDADGKEVKPD